VKDNNLSYFIRLIRSLTEPKRILDEPDRRRMRILTWLLYALISMVSVALGAVLFLEDLTDPRRSIYLAFIGMILVFLGFALRLNLTGRYTSAAAITVTCAVFGPWLSILRDPTVLNGDFVPLVYITLSVQLCAILLSERLTLILAVIQFAALTTFPIFIPAARTFNWPSLLVFIFFVSMLSVIANFISRRDLKQIDLQTQQLIRNETQLRELSVRDPLTGLFNRRYLEETLGRELNRAERKHQEVGIIMMDIDHFKHINDTHGHAAGDAVLHELSVNLRSQIRGSDIVCRYGGEEFIFVMPEASLLVTQDRAESIRREISQMRLRYENHLLERITLSLGVAIFPVHGATSAKIIAAADAALYRAKREGRDCVVIAE
jgi:diguanylate cyclase (GGDEF)-like protein